jgi:hypothetical protein
MTLLDRYQEALRNTPTPNGGCHTAILGSANQGILASLSAEQIFSDIRQAIPQDRTGRINP